MRLPDIYFTRNPLEGHIYIEGKSEPPTFKQGEDVIFDQFLVFENTPLDPKQWDIEVIVKKTVYAKTVLWKGTLGNGLYKKDVPGYYQILIPSEATSTFLAGTYWMDIMIHEKIGNSNGIKDRDVVLSTQPFAIAYSAASPHSSDLDRGSVEKTEPKSWDIRH